MKYAKMSDVHANRSAENSFFLAMALVMGITKKQQSIFCGTILMWSCWEIMNPGVVITNRSSFKTLDSIARILVVPTEIVPTLRIVT